MFHASMRPFLVLLTGQTISLFGSVLTGFALAIWAYQQAESQAFAFGAIAIANSLPIFLLGPIAGAAADRWNRKKIILVSQIAAICITAALTVLYHLKILTLWHIIALVALNSGFTAFVLPTVSATVPLMVPKQFLTRANGLIALAFGIIELASPAISGALYSNFGLKTIFLIDLSTFTIGILAIIFTAIPKAPEKDLHGHEVKKDSFKETIRIGYQYILQERSILTLMIFFSILAASIRVIGLMVQPMILGFTDAKMLGIIMSSAGSGVLFGSLVLIILKEAKAHMPIIFGVASVIAVACFFTPITQNFWLLGLGGFVVMACFPILDSHCRVLFQRKIDPAILGRVIGFRNFILGIFQTISILSVAWLADHVFEPRMQEGGSLAQWLAPYYNTGAGRGMAVLMSLLGLTLFIILVVSMFNRRLRRIDIDLEDIDIDLEAAQKTAS